MTKLDTPLFIVNVEGVVRRDNRYLLTLRSDREPHAPGTLGLPGGKVEYSDTVQDTLETALLREIFEETGVRAGNPVYLESKWFSTDDGERVVDVVFLCDYLGGDATPRDADEIAEVLWLTLGEVAAHSKTPPWTRQSLATAERTRRDPARHG